MPAPLSERLLTTSQRYLGSRKNEHRLNINNTIEEFRKKPEVLDRLVSECDGAIDSLNSYFQKPYELVRGDSFFTPQSKRLWLTLQGQTLPTIAGSDNEKASVETFKRANKYMENGEEGKPGWSFHTAPQTPDSLAASAMVELWAENVTVRFPHLSQIQAVWFQRWKKCWLFTTRIHCFLSKYEDGTVLKKVFPLCW